MRYFFTDENKNQLIYNPIHPQPDSDELCVKGYRIMLVHTRDRGPVIKVAPEGIITAGWVVGVEHL